MNTTSHNHIQQATAARNNTNTQTHQTRQRNLVPWSQVTSAASWKPHEASNLPGQRVATVLSVSTSSDAHAQCLRRTNSAFHGATFRPWCVTVSPCLFHSLGDWICCDHLQCMYASQHKQGRFWVRCRQNTCPRKLIYQQVQMPQFWWNQRMFAVPVKPACPWKL